MSVQRANTMGYLRAWRKAVSSMNSRPKASILSAGQSRLIPQAGPLNVSSVARTRGRCCRCFSQSASVPLPLVRHRARRVPVAVRRDHVETRRPVERQSGAEIHDHGHLLGGDSEGVMKSRASSEGEPRRAHALLHLGHDPVHHVEPALPVKINGILKDHPIHHGRLIRSPAARSRSNAVSMCASRLKPGHGTRGSRAEPWQHEIVKDLLYSSSLARFPLAGSSMGSS